MPGRFIAAFDFATACGCADGSTNDAKPRLFSWYLDDAGEGRAPRLAFFQRFLAAYFQEQQVDEVVYEKPLGIAVIAQLMGRGQFRVTEDGLLLLRGGIGVLEACAAHAGIPVRGIDIKDARKHLVGQRTFPKGADAKAATIRAATSLGWKPENDNEADAAALWSLACGQANPRMAAAGRAHLAAKEDLPTRRATKDRGPGPLFAEPKR